MTIGPLRAELLKLRRSRSTWVLGGLLVVGLVLFTYLLVYLVLQQPSPGRTDPEVEASRGALLATLAPSQLATTVLSDISGLGGPLVLILGAMSMAREYTWGTVRLLLTHTASRFTMVIAKLGALAVVLAILVIAAFVAGAFGAWLVATLRGVSTSFPPAEQLLRAAGIGWLILAAWCAVGVTLGTVLRSTGLAIGLGLVYALVIESLVRALARNLSFLEAISRGMLQPNASTLAASVGSPSAAGRVGDGLTPNSPGVAAAVLVAYLLAAVAVSVVAVRIRDVS